MARKREVNESTVASRQKWIDIRDGKMVDKGYKNCPLCKMFRRKRFGMISCRGCPVRVNTGFNACIDTPYDDFVTYYSNYHRDAFSNSSKVFDKDSWQLAQDEVIFLNNLLPKRLQIEVRE